MSASISNALIGKHCRLINIAIILVFTEKCAGGISIGPQPLAEVWITTVMVWLGTMTNAHGPKKLVLKPIP